MQIGILGAGNIGATLARHLVGVGHEVAIANSRGPATLAGLAEQLGPQGRAATAEEAALFGRLVIVAIPFGRYRELPADRLAGKVVVDTTNYYPDRDGELDALRRGNTTSSEMLAQHIPDGRLVKAFNTIYWEQLRDRTPVRGAGRRAIPIAGDDAEAKQVVVHLLDELGFDAVDAGPLADGGRKLQPGSAVYNVPYTRDDGERALAEGR